MRVEVAWGVAGIVTVLAASAVTLAVAGDGQPGEERAVAERIDAGSIVARQPGPVVRGAKRKPTIAAYFAQNPTVPDEGEGALVEIKCPSDAGAAIGGGARTSVGIVLGYLSKGSPRGNSSERGYYVGVDDNSSTNEVDAGAYVEVQCAKGIRVP